jgi:signal transduction histidine kinase
VAKLLHFKEFLAVKNEIAVLILQDHSTGLESLHNDLRRVQLLPHFSHVSSCAELSGYLGHQTPDVILLVRRHFKGTFKEVLHELERARYDIPVIVILASGEESDGMDLLLCGAQDYVVETQLDRLAPSIYIAIRYADVQAAKEHAERRERLKMGFLANVSHEIRTPMSSILGFASVLTENLVGNELAEYSVMIEENGRRLLETINGILDIAKIESNEVKLRPELISVRNEVLRVVTLLEQRAREKKIVLSTQMPEEVEAFLDAQYLGRVLLNLIGNAVKFTHEGSVHVRVEVQQALRMLEICIADTGIGISEDFFPHLFNEFKQEISGGDRNYEGTGLGLTITKRLVELMGGTIVVESVKGQGSTFIVRLPSELEARST